MSEEKKNKMVHVGIIEGVAFPMVFKHVYADGIEKDSVDLDKIHEMLEVGTRFRDWSESVLQGVKYAKEGVNLEKGTFALDSRETGRPRKRYIVTIRLAQIIAARDSSEIGQDYLNYLIAFEEKVKTNLLEDIKGKFVAYERRIETLEGDKARAYSLVDELKEELEYSSEGMEFGYKLSEAAQILSNVGTKNITMKGLIQYLTHTKGWIRREKVTGTTTKKSKGPIIPAVKGKRYTQIMTRGEDRRYLQTRLTSKGLSLLLKEVRKIDYVLGEYSITKRLEGEEIATLYLTCVAKTKTKQSAEEIFEANFGSFRKKEEIN